MQIMVDANVHIEKFENTSTNQFQKNNYHTLIAPM